MSRRLLRLYPRAWRERHEAEVGALLDDTGSGLRDAPDLLRGAVDAHLHPGPMGLPQGRLRRWSTTAHVGGLGAFAGGAMLLVAQSGKSILDVTHRSHLGVVTVQGYAVGTALALSLLSLAMMLLLVRHLEGWRSRIAGVLAVISMTVSVGIVDRHLVRSLLEGDMFIGFGPAPLEMFVVGCVLAVLAIWGRRHVSRRSLAFLAGASALLILSFEPSKNSIGILRDAALFQDVGSPLVKLLGGIFEVTRYSSGIEMMVFAVAWSTVGWSAIRRSTGTDEVRPAALA